MRPKLLGDAYFVPLPNDGLYVRSSHRIVRIADIPIYPWMERIAPYLTGEHELAELTGDLPEQKAKLVRDLVHALYDHGVVRDLDNDLPHSLTEEELCTYAGELTYLETYVDSAAHRFQRYREGQIILLGCGLAIECCVFSALRSGIRRVKVLLTSEQPTDTARLAEFLRMAQIRDPRQELVFSAAPNQDAGIDQWIETLRPASIVLHVASSPMLGRALAVDRACLAAGIPLIQGIPSEDEAWIGPVTTPGMRGYTWESAWRRLSDCAGDFRDDPNPSSFFVGTVPSIVANHVLFRCFTWVTGSDAGSHHRLLRLSLETLETSTHRFHPYVPASPQSENDASRLEERVRVLRQGSPQSDKEFSETAITLIDARAGLFRSIDEDGLQQLPLRIARVTWKDRTDQAPFEAYGYALDFEAARINAMRRGVELRALQDWHERHAGNGTWAMSLTDLIPVQIASSEIRSSAGYADNPIGVACGRTWDEAVCAGLLQWVEKATVDAAHRSKKAFGVVRDELIDQNADVRHLKSLARHLDPHLTVYDLTGDLSVPTFAFCRGQTVVAYGSGLSSEVALQAGFERSIYALQTQRSWSDRLPADLPLDDRGRFELLALPPRFKSDPLQTLSDAFAVEGYKVSVVLLNQDFYRAAIIPYVIWVVCTLNGIPSAED
jgi:putative thiazole-containing bacteriocin maturation protein